MVGAGLPVAGGSERATFPALPEGFAGFLFRALGAFDKPFNQAPSLHIALLVIGAICLVSSLVLIQTGMNIGVALMLLSFVGVWSIKGPVIAGKLAA